VNDSTTAQGQIGTVNFFQHLDCFYLPFVIKIESVFYTKGTLKQWSLPKTTKSQAKGFTTKMQIYMVNLRVKNIQLTKKSYIFEQFITRSKTWLHTCFKIGDKITNSSFHCEANQRKCLYPRLAHYFTPSETFWGALKIFKHKYLGLHTTHICTDISILILCPFVFFKLHHLC